MPVENKTVLITGATGLIGTALADYLTRRGFRVFPLVRQIDEESAFYWRPEIGEIHFDPNIRLDAVVHLAGANLSDRRWSTSTKKNIIDSRVVSTQLLCNSLATLQHRPKVLISASAIGFYGDTGDREVDESSESGGDFLSQVSVKWEAASKAAMDAGIRTVHIRTGVVLSKNGGMLEKLLLPYKLGLGGVIGSGNQYISWVSIEDVVKMIFTLIENDCFHGPVNLVSNNPVTNREFVRALGGVLHRPTLIPMPGILARAAFGEMADALLLGGNRVVPKKLNEFGYEFEKDNLADALKGLLS